MKKFLLAVSMLCMGIAANADHKPGHNNGNNNGFGGSNIDARRQGCYTDLCTYDLSWRVRGQSSVVILEVRGGPENGAVKLLGCSGQTGYSNIPWIRRDCAQYIFHLFDSNRCTQDIVHYERPVDSVTIQEYGNGGGGGDGSGDIDARRIQCYSDMCTYDLSWRVRGNGSVVTLVDTGTGRERLFACAGSSGHQEANWIARNGTRYEFRLYDSDRCTADVGKFARPADRVIVREN